MRVIVVHVPVASVDHVGLGGAGGFQDADHVRVRHHAGFVYAIGTQLLILQEELHEYLTLCNATALQPVTFTVVSRNEKSLRETVGGPASHWSTSGAHGAGEGDSLPRPSTPLRAPGAEGSGATVRGLLRELLHAALRGRFLRLVARA